MTTIGIDLGTTYSVVATLGDDGQPIALPNHLGELLTPSVVDLATGAVGTPAKDKASDGVDGVVAFFKRDMGNPQALYLHGGKTYTPVDLSAMVLAYMKESAQAALGRRVTDAVITVPAYFNNMQRQATLQAGERAGLNVLRIINEPTAAAMAYGLRPQDNETYLLVYDLGGGTFDVSLVGIYPDALRVIGTAGDHYLGGKDWDDRILTYIASLFEDEFGIDLWEEDINALLIIAEQAKISLSQRQSTIVTVHAKGATGRYTITRDDLETMTRDLLERTAALADGVLLAAGGSWDDLHGVALVGGATRMPMVQRAVQQMSGRLPMAGLHPDQAVALGAAVQAALDAPHSGPILLLGGAKAMEDVIGNSLGMIAENTDRSAYINSIIIPKNQAIPAHITRPYQLRVGGRRDRNRLEVFMTQGETESPQDCTYLGKYVFTGIPASAGRQVVIDITYSYNINGMVEVSALERQTRTPLALQIEPLPHDVPARFLLPPEDIQTQEPVSVYLAIDVSGSMMGSPLEEARRAAHSFVAELDLSTTSVGIIEWSDTERILQEATQNANKIAYAIGSLQPGRTGLGTGGNPFKPIFKQLQRVDGHRYGVVLTDGALYKQPAAIASADECRRAGIEIMAIGFGAARKDFLQRVSSSDQHSFFLQMSQLTTAFSTIAQVITEGGGHVDQAMLQSRRRDLRLLE